ncbi:hypothetical protein Tco_0816588 [Tanacetum coccineum]
MEKIIKGEFEKLEDLKVKDVSLTCDTSLEVFNNEFNRLSGMDDDLFTYEVEVANILCDSNKDDDSEQRMSHEADDDMGYDPSDVAFTEWLGGDDEVELTDEEFSDNEDEVAEVFRIDTNIFDFETPIYTMGMKTKTDVGDGTEPKPVKHTCKPFNYKTGCSEWPTCSWRKDGYCNGGNLPGAYHIGNSLHYQDLEWYKALKDNKLKNKALRNKAIIEGLIGDDESYNDCGRRWKSYEINYHDYNKGEYENETHEEGHEICGIETRKVPVCQIKRYKMIKYSFNDEEEYVAVKEDEYDDLTITSDEACRAYREINRMMDEGWMVTRNE